MNENETNVFCLNNYDAYGFDLDHTLAKYNLVNLIQLCYNSLVEYFVKDCGLSENLHCDIHKYKDFICKGLFIDLERGNVIKISHNGKIFKGSHGTRMMSEEELTSVYGESRIWEHFQEAREAVTSTTGKQTFMFWENYFSSPAVLACARLVDQLDIENDGPLESYKSILWRYLPSGLDFIYRYQGYADNTGYVFPGIKANPAKYYQPCSEGVKQWLKDLKQKNKCVFLTTSSHIDFASLTAESTLGPEWKSYFDVIIANARKPAFFKDNKPFLSLDDDLQESDPVSRLEEHGTYSSGNNDQLEELLTRVTGVEKPKVVYFGDSLCSDAYPVKKFTDWDVVLVLEEMEAEGYHPEANTHHYMGPEEKAQAIVRKVNLNVDVEEEAFILSKQWGSFFYQPEDDPKHNRHMNTFWGEIISKYSDIAVPSVEYIAGLPLDHKFSRFDHQDDGSTTGFSPAKPLPLLQLKSNQTENNTD